jgi:hypothetical protein
VSRAGTNGTGLPASDQEERKKQTGLRPSPKVTTAPGAIPTTAATSGKVAPSSKASSPPFELPTTAIRSAATSG